MLIRVGTIGNALFDEARQVPGQQPGAVLDAVDPGVEHVIQGVFGEAVRGDAGAFIVGGPDGVLDGRGGKAGGEVAGVAVDPVPHELDPAVARAGLLPHGLDQTVRLHLDGEAPEVAPGAGNVPAGADDPGQVARCWSQRVSWTAPASRTSSVPASRSVVACCSATCPVTSPAGPSPMWQCASTRPGMTQPSSTSSGAARRAG